MAKEQKLPPLSEAQLEVMNAIWAGSECSVGDVWKILHERRGVSRNTVHTLIVRLAEKGWLQQRRERGRILYRATVSREHTQQRTVKKMVDTLFHGSAEGLVLALLSSDALSKSEADRIRQLIADAKGRKS
jgi:BlaI family transcriptional regulator, penicillinase repressor